MSYEEQIMSKDKYPDIFSPQMEAVVFIIFQIFFPTRAVLKIGEYLTSIHQSGGKYPTLVTDTEVSSCFSVYKNSEIIHSIKN